MEEAKSVIVNQVKEHPKNLLDRFSPQEHPRQTQHSNSQSLHEPDLNLTLSLGSTESENYSKENSPLTRSSSVAGVISLRKDSGEVEKGFLSLARSCSLPTEAEQEQRLITMRELQAMRRIEAKNRLVERQRIYKEAKEKEKSSAVLEPMPPLPAETAAWTAASPAKSPALYRTIVKIKAQGSLAESQKGMYFPLTSPTPGSLHELDGSAAPNQPSRFNSSSDRRNAESVITTGTTSNGVLVPPAETKPENPYKRARITNANFEDNGIDVMRQMPSVTTTGDGPNGRRIEGFLYTYTRGHVSIVCVCHGSFLSPAEFVKHAGGKDVSNPMKHITVYSALSA